MPRETNRRARASALAEGPEPPYLRVARCSSRARSDPRRSQGSAGAAPSGRARDRGIYQRARAPLLRESPALAHLPDPAVQDVRGQGGIVRMLEPTARDRLGEPLRGPAHRRIRLRMGDDPAVVELDVQALRQ